MSACPRSAGQRSSSPGSSSPSARGRLGRRRTGIRLPERVPSGLARLLGRFATGLNVGLAAADTYVATDYFFER